MLGLAGLTKGIDRRVFDEPDFIWRVGGTRFGKSLHGTPDGFVGRRARPCLAHHSTIDTIGCPCRARYKPSSCSREVAVTVKVSPM